MGPVFELSLRQLTGKWRLAIIVLVAAVPVAVVLAFRAAGGAEDRLCERPRRRGQGIPRRHDNRRRAAHRYDDIRDGQLRE